MFHRHTPSNENHAGIDDYVCPHHNVIFVERYIKPKMYSKVIKLNVRIVGTGSQNNEP